MMLAWLRLAEDRSDLGRGEEPCSDRWWVCRLQFGDHIG